MIKQKCNLQVTHPNQFNNQDIISQLQKVLAANYSDSSTIIEQINKIIKNVQEKETVKSQPLDDDIQNQINNFCTKINEIEETLKQQEFKDLFSKKTLCIEASQRRQSQPILISMDSFNKPVKTESINKLNPLESLKKSQQLVMTKQVSERVFKKPIEEKKTEKLVPFAEKRIQELSESNLKLEQKIKELNSKCQIFSVSSINQQNQKMPALVKNKQIANIVLQLILRLNVNSEHSIEIETEQSLSVIICRNILKVELLKTNENRFVIFQKNFGGFSTIKLTFENLEEPLFILRQIEKHIELAKSLQKPNKIFGQISTYLS